MSLVEWLNQSHLHSHRGRKALLFIGSCLSLWPGRGRGENHVDYRYEYYGEEADRITVHTHSAYFEQQLADSIVAHGELTYDGISGATPTGASPVDGHIPKAHLTDVRRAASVGFDFAWGRQTLTPGFAFSTESDYESYAVSGADAIEFNEKNTVLQLGVAHNFDSVLDASSPRRWQHKDVTEGFFGFSQLLGPKTIMAATFTYGVEDGYLSDPYRLATFDMFGFAFHERRPEHKDRVTFLVSLTQHVECLRGSVEGSYRFYHDSYDIFAHTFMLTWRQRVGKRLLLEPRFRFTEQSAASFYAVSFPGLTPPERGAFSSDYRLSELYTLDYGLQATVIATEWLRFVAGYHRYEMHGLGDTPAGMYPVANVVSAGIQLWF